MPGGGAMKKMSASVSQKWKPVTKAKKQPVDSKYTKPSKGEKGQVDQSKVAMLKAKPNRPKPLKRKPTTKLSKAEKKKLIASRKEAKAKYAERSQQTKKDLVYKKNALKRHKKKTKTLKKHQKKSLPKTAPMTPPTFPNILEMIYSVGPDPKYKAISMKFREYRKFAKAQLKHSKSKSSKSGNISYLYKVGMKKSVPAK